MKCSDLTSQEEKTERKCPPGSNSTKFLKEKLKAELGH
jgi:hypothetical protein